MALNQWFKLYGGEYLSDPKIASLTPQERSCWITLLCLSSISSTPGHIEFLTVESLLQKSGIVWDPYNPDEWDKALSVLGKFVRMKMITKDDDGTIEVLNWRKRQETALTNAERQAKFRASNEKVTEPVTKVTLDKIRVDKSKETENKFSTFEGNPTTDEDYEIVSDKPQKEKNPPKNKQALALREKLYDLFEREGGVRPTTHVGDYLRVLEALKRMKEKEILELVEEGIDSGKKRTVREALTAREIDIYLQDNS